MFVSTLNTIRVPIDNKCKPPVMKVKKYKIFHKFS